MHVRRTPVAGEPPQLLSDEDLERLHALVLDEPEIEPGEELLVDDWALLHAPEP